MNIVILKTKIWHKTKQIVGEGGLNPQTSDLESIILTTWLHS